LKMSEFDCCVTDLDEKCAECKYADKSAFSEPCVECGFNYSRFEQKEEAVKPLREHSGGGATWWYVCGACRTAINPNDKFCHECGKKVKWDEDKRSG